MNTTDQHFFHIQSSGNNSLRRWEEVVTTYRTEILHIIQYIKQEELSIATRYAFRLWFRRGKKHDAHRAELHGIARLLCVSVYDVFLYQIACEYFIESCTIVSQRKRLQDVIFFRGLKTKLDILQSIFIHLKVYSKGEYKYKAVGIAGYVGYICVVFPNNTIASVEHVQKINNFSLMQSIARYHLYGWTPGKMLRFVIEENDYSCSNIVLHTMKNNKASVPFRVNVVDIHKHHYKIEYHNIKKYVDLTIVQTYGDYVKPMLLSHSNEFALRKYVVKNDEQSIFEKYNYVFLYYSF